MGMNYRLDKSGLNEMMFEEGRECKQEEQLWDELLMYVQMEESI